MHNSFMLLALISRTQTMTDHMKRLFIYNRKIICRPNYLKVFNVFNHLNIKYFNQCNQCKVRYFLKHNPTETTYLENTFFLFIQTGNDHDL